MKKLSALLGIIAGVALLTAQTATAQTNPPAPAAKPGAPTKPVEKEEPKIPGIVLQRPNGNQLGLTISGGTFKVSFYDKKRKHVPVDVTRAVARWNPVYKAIPEQAVLNIVDDGKALGGGRPVLPPYSFVLRLTLFKGDGEAEQPAEPTYVISVQEAALNQK
jgi:hypothetical protein